MSWNFATPLIYLNYVTGLICQAALLTIVSVSFWYPWLLNALFVASAVACKLLRCQPKLYKGQRAQFKLAVTVSEFNKLRVSATFHFNCFSLEF